MSSRQYKIVAPTNVEKPIKYVRKPIDYTILDEIGHGLAPSQKQKNRVSSQGSIQMIHMNQNPSVGPPPTTKPPTPPQSSRGNAGTLVKGMTVGSTGTLGKSNREYRTPPVVVPPQVPSHYAPNYPMGHPRRQSSERPGYSALPVVQPQGQQIQQQQQYVPSNQVSLLHYIHFAVEHSS